MPASRESWQFHLPALNRDGNPTHAESIRRKPYDSAGACSFLPFTSLEASTRSLALCQQARKPAATKSKVSPYRRLPGVSLKAVLLTVAPGSLGDPRNRRRTSGGADFMDLCAATLRTGPDPAAA